MSRERPRIAVYAIARDEERHVDRWVTSVREADDIVLVDTGSTDGTVGRARKLGIANHEIRVEPFRYDVARNGALDLLPPDVDVCVSLDLDEVLDPGWRQHLEDAWRQGATRVRCWYKWPWSEIFPALRFTTDVRIHARHGYRWRFPVHEEPVSLGTEVVVASPLQIRHLRDAVGSRPHYLPLLRLRAAEHPDDGRTAHLLASEARMSGLREEALVHERRALALPLNPNERLHAMLMLAFLEPEARETRLLAACAEFSERREPWCDLAQLHFDRGAWRACRAAAQTALRIEHPADDYLTNPFAWGPWPDQLAARASLELGDHDWAVHHARRALRVLPGDGELAALLGRATDALCRRSGPERRRRRDGESRLGQGGPTAARQIWTDALVLPGQADLRRSLVAELAEYLGQSIGEVEARCRASTAQLARAWQEAAPTSPAAVARFYRECDTYLYELTWWHALGWDDTALVQVQALERALAVQARIALDFGCGIGSLGLLLARHGLAVTLADVNPRLLAYARWRFARRGLKARFLDLRHAPLPERGVDLVAAVDVLEHLPDPGVTLEALGRALRPGGLLFVNFPGPDPAHPMHLWESAAVLRPHLSAAGLVTEQVAGSTLLLRRATPGNSPALGREHPAR